MSAKRRVTSQALQIPALLIWLIAALGVPYQFMLQATPNVMIPSLMHDLGVSQASVGFLTSNFFYTYLLCQIPAGLLVDRFGVRKVLSGSIALAALACLFFAFSSHFAVASASRLLMGLVTAPCVPAIMFLAAKLFPPHRFVILAGLAESIGMLGGAVGEAVLGGVVTWLGWRGTMLGCAGVGLVVALLMYFIIRDTQSGDDTTATRRLSEVVLGFVDVMKCSQVWLIAVYGGLIFALLPALAGLWIVPIMQDVYGLDIKFAALGSSVMFFGTALGLPVWGYLSERLGRRKPILFIATGLSALLMAVFAYGPRLSLGLVYLQLGIMGFVSAVYVLAFALVRERTCRSVRASAMGLTNMMSMIIGAPLLQPLIGTILDQHERLVYSHTRLMPVIYQHALTALVVCLLLAFALIFFIRETYCNEQRELV